MIKASIYLGAFYIVYFLLLRKDTLYSRNRTNGSLDHIY